MEFFVFYAQPYLAHAFEAKLFEMVIFRILGFGNQFWKSENLRNLSNIWFRNKCFSATILAEVMMMMFVAVILPFIFLQIHALGFARNTKVEWSNLPPYLSQINALDCSSKCGENEVKSLKFSMNRSICSVWRHSSVLQYDLLNLLYGCKMALRTLTIAMLRERQARAPKAVWARFPWCDRKAKYALAVTHLRYYVVMGPRKQRVDFAAHTVVSTLHEVN